MRLVECKLNAPDMIWQMAVAGTGPAHNQHGILLDCQFRRVYGHLIMIARLFITLCLATLALQSIKADELSFNINIDIQKYDFQLTSNYALAFGIQNVGKTSIAGGHLKGMLAKGTVHVLPTGGLEQQRIIAEAWFLQYGIVPNDLSSGDTWKDRVASSDLMLFLAKNGDYQVWWSIGDLKSNVLHFTVTNGTVQLIKSQKPG
jgi:hypothetical protein